MDWLETMCRVVVWTQTRLDQKDTNYAPGDVICVVDDKHVFSDLERKSPKWRILDIPDINKEDMYALIMPERDPNTTNKALVRKRNASLDLAALPIDVKDWLTDNRVGREETKILVLTKEQALALIKPKSPKQTRFKTFS